MPILRKYDLSYFIKKHIRKIQALYLCNKKRLPLKMVFLCDADPSLIPTGTIISHPFGICISSNTKLGSHVDIRQGVTIGTKNPRIPQYQGAIIGDNVFLGANSTILGPVKVGDNSIIGAHSLVLKDVPANSVIVGIWK